jgi:hypothetical protein
MGKEFVREKIFAQEKFATQKNECEKKNIFNP